MDANKTPPNLDAHHNGYIKLIRTDGITPVDTDPDAYANRVPWNDGTVSVVLHMRDSDEMASWIMADELDTIIRFVDTLRTGTDRGAGTAANALRHIRSLRRRLDAIEDEAILYARETTNSYPRNKPRLSFTEIATELGVEHPTIVKRHQRLSTGHHSTHRSWLVQDTDRAAMYQPTNQEEDDQ